MRRASAPGHAPEVEPCWSVTLSMELAVLSRASPAPKRNTCEVGSVQCSGIAWCSALGSAPIYFVLFFCSFLLLGRAPRASRPTGRSCSCVLRPPRSSDKILSSWKPRSQESVENPMN